MAQQQVGDQRKEKPQYYYFYGSTDYIDNRTNNNGNGLVASGTDQDSLVGESFIPTDNEHEEDVAVNDSVDMPHVLLLKGDEVRPLLVNKASDGNHRFFGKISFTSFKKNATAYISLWVGGASLLLFAISVITLHFSNSGSFLASPSSQAAFTMPFPTVDRVDFGDPVASFLQKHLFHSRFHYKGRDPSRVFTFPFPSGAFWVNLVLPVTANHGLSYPTAVYPYAYAWSDDLLQVSYPAGHRQEDAKAVHDYAIPDLAFGCREGTMSRHVEHFDPLSVTLKYGTMSGGFWESYLVQGSPYVTIRYKNSMPAIRAFPGLADVFCPRDEDGDINFDGRRKLMFGVCSSERSEDGKTDILRGIQFVMQTTDNKYWFVFASEPVSLLYNRVEKVTVEAEQSFNGVLRFAYVPSIRRNVEGINATDSDVGSSEYLKVSSSKALQRLVYHAGVYPTGGKVSWTFRPASTTDTTHGLVTKTLGSLEKSTKAASGTKSATSSLRAKRLGTIRFEYSTETFAPSNSKNSISLLMLALPHHAQSLPGSGKLTPGEFELSYRSIKGPMTPVLGSTWMYDEVLPSLGFDGDSGSSTMDALRNPFVRQQIVRSLNEDIKLSLPTVSEDIYGFGKQSARLAQLAHIADVLLKEKGDDKIADGIQKDNLSDILQQAVEYLSDSLERFLTNKVTDGLVYDANLGGLVTSNGLLDSQADFGNGRYNDHHFHYGYILYACAVMGSLNSTFVERFGKEVDAIYYDIAHSTNLDSTVVDGVFFPAARHKSWFDGHSFASGLFPFGNGKSQESSSEAVNGYYGAYLWSIVRHGAGSNPESDVSTETDFARLLLATEIRGARTYWHMSPTRSQNNQTSLAATTYSQEFSKNYMVGNLGMMDAICSTWFGTKELYVHMINFLPVTSVTGELFSEDYVRDEYFNVLESQASSAEMAWKGYVVANHAIVDPSAAWTEAQDLISSQLDSALSKSQLLYWIATRSNFDKLSTMNGGASDTDKRGSTSHNRSGPQSYNASGVPEIHDGLKSSYSSGGTCKSTPRCAELNLTGDCCPSPSGLNLDCCSR